MKKIPHKRVTIPQRPRFLPEHLSVIVFETCVFCKAAIETRDGWRTRCEVAPEGIHQKRIVVVDSRP